MADPLTLSLVGSWAALEGIKFLYGQAAELIKARRERLARAQAGESVPEKLEVPIIPCEALDQTPSAGLADPAVLDAEGGDLVKLVGVLAPYAQGLADPDLGDTALAEQAGRVRAVLEAAYGQRFTFRGEQREPTGTRVTVTQVLGRVAGQVTGAEADVAKGGQVDVNQQATSVETGASVVGFKGRVGHAGPQDAGPNRQ